MGYRGVVQVLLGFKADKEAKDIDERTPLHSAAVHGCDGILQILLTLGVGIQAKHREGHTPLILANVYKNYEAARVVQEYMIAVGKWHCETTGIADNWNSKSEN